MPTILVEVNQTVMLSLAMVVVTSLIGALLLDRIVQGKKRVKFNSIVFFLKRLK